jgi:hypothetical protein
MAAGCAYGQLTVGTNDIWRLKKGDIVVTNVTLTGVVYTNSAELAQKIDTNETRAVKLNTLTVTNMIMAVDGSKSINPNTRELLDSDGLTMIDWTGVLRDGYRQSLDFVNRGLLDSTEKSSVNWQDRLLNYSDYETALDWGTPGLFKVGGGLTINGTNVMTEIAGKVGTAHTNDAAAHPQLDARYPSKASIENNAEAGRCWGGDVSATNSTIYIKAGGGYVKAEGATLNAIPSSPTNGAGSALVYVTWAATNLTALTGYNIVYWDASAGMFKNGLKENMGSFFDFTQDFTVGRVWYDPVYGPVARLCGMNRWSKDRRQQIFSEQIHPVEVGSGGVMSGSGLSFSVTAAEVWAEGENYFTTSAKAVTANFYTWYQTNTVWIYTTGTNVNNTQYNVITGDTDGLANMVVNRWRADYVYLVHDGSVHVVMGQAQYTSAALAEDAARPTPPPLCAAYGTLIARITIQQGATSMTVVNQDNVSFNEASIPDHGSLAGLQGGTAGEYYHVNAAQHTALIGNQFTNQYWTAAGTNATYRIYWDITNGTFGVQEILP